MKDSIELAAEVLKDTLKLDLPKEKIQRAIELWIEENLEDIDWLYQNDSNFQRKIDRLEASCIPEEEAA